VPRNPSAILRFIALSPPGRIATKAWMPGLVHHGGEGSMCDVVQLAFSDPGVSFD
jgi:hypothetical protein